MSDLKKKLEEIQKLASKLPEKVAFTPKGKMQNPPGSGAASPAPTGGGGGGGTKGGRFTHNVQPGQKAPVQHGGGGGYYSPAIGPIKDMQEAMQRFAAAVVSYSKQKPAPTQPGQKPGQQPAQQPGFDSNKKPFNDFITMQYMSGSDIKGEEYNPDPKAVKKDQKLPTDLTEMNIVLDSLKRIGSERSELNADNAWDFRTNNALKNIYAFAYGLVNLSKDFGKTNVQSFGDDDLGKLAEAIPQDRNPKDVPVAEKIEKAKTITALIDKLARFYKYYVQAIATHPAWTRYISKNEPMMTLQKGGGDPTQLDADQQAMMKNIDSLSLGDQAVPNLSRRQPIKLPGAKGEVGIGSLPISVLQSREALRAFMVSSLQYPRNQADEPAYQKAVLDALTKHIDAVVNMAQSQQTQKPA